MTERNLFTRVAAMVGARVTAGRRVYGGSIAKSHRIELADGRLLFAKTLADPPESFFAAETAGLRLLASSEAVAVPEVVATEPDLLLLRWVEPGTPTKAQAERLGRELAALHQTPAAGYGANETRYLGLLPLSTPRDTISDPADWPAFHVEHRLLPFLRLAVDRDALHARDKQAVEQLCDNFNQVAGPPQPPVIIHGDLWSGNLLWAADGRTRLIDPATQGGHPETDLALLELFGCPGLDRLLAAYQEERPLPGREQRRALHQVQHLLVHAALFGRGYSPRCGDAARKALA